MQFKAPSYKIVEPGMYVATIDNIEERTGQDGRAYAMWSFKIVDLDDDEVIIKRPTSLNFGPKSHARKFAEAALGRPIRPGEIVEPADLVGKQVKILVKNDTDSAGNIRNRVADEVFPVR